MMKNRICLITVFLAIAVLVSSQKLVNITENGSKQLNEKPTADQDPDNRGLNEKPNAAQDPDVPEASNPFSGAMIRLLPITNQQDFLATESKLGMPQEAKQIDQKASNRKSDDPTGICQQCSCPKYELDNPYLINCMALELTQIPDWDRVLDLDNSNISNVHLQLDNNKFEIVSLISESHVIDYISFKNNLIHGIEPFAFADLPNLKRLMLSYNRLESIHPSAFHMSEFESLPIEVLDLSHNNLHHLESNVFEDAYYLTELNLQGNPISFLDSSTVLALNNLVALLDLNLAETGLSMLPMGLLNPITHLESLSLRENHFNRVPEVLANAGELIDLILSANPIFELDAASFIEMGKLEFLEMNEMPELKIIHKGTFHPLKSLKILKINENQQLKSIELGSVYDEYGNGPIDLQRVELQSNQLHTLSRDVFFYFHDDVQYLDVRYNPFNCTCELGWMKSEPAVANPEGVQCWNPPALRDKSVIEVDFAEVACPAGELHHAVFSMFQLTPAERYFFLVMAMLLSMLSIIAIIVLIFHSKMVCGKKNKIYQQVTLTPRNRPPVQQVKHGNSGSVKYERQIDEDEFNEDI